jgi:predicted O-methyltransferase YrrM
MNEITEDLIAGAAAALGSGLTRVAVIGIGAEALEVAAALEELGGQISIFDPRFEGTGHPRLRQWSELGPSDPELVVIALDAEKEELLRAAAGVLDEKDPLPRVILAGLAHQEQVDPLLEELEAPALVPSYATGHPHTRAHLYDCLRAAATNGHEGAVVELGAFKGGTSVWLARAIQMLGLQNTKMIAFDAWDGFPPRRSLLDLYEHPRCVFRDFEAVRAYTEPHGIELVVGDIAETAPRRLAEEPILLAFVDTDNYSGARVALEVIRDNLVVGGAIVFDHYFTTFDYAYTVGERIAATEGLGNAGLLHLHGTGVFVKVA